MEPSELEAVADAAALRGACSTILNVECSELWRLQI